MAIVPIRDDYADTSTAGTTWAMHTPISLGSGRAVLVTSTAGAQARVYTLSDTGWDRGDPASVDVDCTLSRASAATADGNVLVQGAYGSATSYQVLDVNGTSITPGTPTPVADGGGPDTWGPCITGPDAMAQIPLTNRFWAWRNYPTIGIVTLDLIEVSGTTVTIHDTARVASDGYAAAYTPHQLIPISSSEVISILSMPDRLKLVHATVTNNAITLATQDITGYPATEDVTLVPGVNHHAELLVPAGGSDPLLLIRNAVQWQGTSFSLTSLPITQLTSSATPPDYSPRTKTARVSTVAGSAAVASSGNLFVARQFRSNGTDDNWLLLTQYDQADGSIIAKTWAKGDSNGGIHDTLVFGEEGLALRWDSAAKRLLFGATETLQRSGADPAKPPRLGVYRVSYVLDQASRDTRQRFER